ncbi:hypothetical protein QE152_g5042 [Popillia japonica]|uniref:Uncharacterized protein n=1 Tax=Popillia japonica TaxID=7064 RepID=A0AAW1N059_POPJA
MKICLAQCIENSETNVTLVGVWKCCLPWCAPAEGKAAPPSPPVETVPESPPRARQPSPHLQDIAEEDSEDETTLEEPTTLQPLGARISYKKRRNAPSPSPTLSAKASRKNQRTRSVTSTTSSECSSSTAPPAGKMQAEQGSIGDLQRYHNRYLRNRRHTLANVR